MGYSSIQFKDYTNTLMPVKVESSSMTQSKLETFATALKAHSNAVVEGVNVFFKNASPGTPVNASHELVKDKALIVMRDANSRIVKTTIPAPKASIFPSTVKGVRIVSQTVGEDVATTLGTATGKTLTFMNGRFVNKPGKAGL
jgi:hypothetical protein